MLTFLGVRVDTSAHKPKCMFLLSAENSRCLSLTCCHCGESYGPRILPSLDMLSPCQVIKDANCGVENILFKRGTNGKCLNTFIGTLDSPIRLYLPASHMGQVSNSVYSRLNSTHPFLHASMASYLKPSLETMVVAIPSLVGSEFGKGRMTVENKWSNSVMHALVTLCVRQTFMNNKVLSNLVKPDPQKRGALHSSLRADASAKVVQPLSPSLSASPSMFAANASSFSSASMSLPESALLHVSMSAFQPCLPVVQVMHSNGATRVATEVAIQEQM